jgi:hypothetical protein
VQVDENTSTVMLDTSGGAWITPAIGTLSGEDVTRRCRHAVTSVGPFVFIYGGLKGSTLLDDLLLAGESVWLLAGAVMHTVAVGWLLGGVLKRLCECLWHCAFMPWLTQQNVFCVPFPVVLRRRCWWC